MGEKEHLSLVVCGHVDAGKLSKPIDYLDVVQRKGRPVSSLKRRGQID